MKKWIYGLWLLAVILVFTGCNMTTVDQMYCLPQRSEEYNNFQSVLGKAMYGMDYSAPLSGENRQTLQTADLNGDGEDEYIVFAKGPYEKPLCAFIFSLVGEDYALIDTLQFNGSAFDQVVYVQMDNRPGLELVIGCQVSDQVLRNVSVYAMRDSQVTQLMSASYTKFLCTDLTMNRNSELFILRSGETDGENGIAELYRLDNDSVERFTEAGLSRPSDNIKRVMVGKLNDDVPAVYVASEVNNSAIITDVFALVDSQFVNVSMSMESGTSIQTLRNYYVYAEDIDGDGVLELPSLVEIDPSAMNSDIMNHHVIRWFSLRSDGTVVNKLYTYHNHAGGWYLRLDSRVASKVTVHQQGNTYDFYMWNEDFTVSNRLMSVVVLTGQKREEQAVANNRFVVYRTETTVYAAKLDVFSAGYGITQESLINSFHLITQDWNNMES